MQRLFVTAGLMNEVLIAGAARPLCRDACMQVGCAANQMQNLARGSVGQKHSLRFWSQVCLVLISTTPARKVPTRMTRLLAVEDGMMTTGASPSGKVTTLKDDCGQCMSVVAAGEE